MSTHDGAAAKELADQAWKSPPDDENAGQITTWYLQAMTVEAGQ